MTLSPEDHDRRYKWYLDCVGHIRSWSEKLSQSQDQFVFAISTGTLVLSVTFVSAIATAHNIQQVGLLRWSWGFLIATIILSMLSTSAAIKSMEHRKRELDSWLKTETLEAPSESSWAAKAAIGLGVLSQWTLVAGIILMVYFASLNINSLIH